MSDVTQILKRVESGETTAASELLPLVYEELRKLAAARMAQQPADHTLQATALVHEAWLKLAGNRDSSWNNRQHFFRAAAEAMRQILIDRARARQRLKRDAGQFRVNLEDVDLAADAEPETLLLVDDALQNLAREHPDKADLVRLRFYAGLNVVETASALGVSEKTIKRQWIHARAWLFREINRLLKGSA
ncbi:MAG: sigma-70 family RNA polymerase sigma factor [Pedosphaera sp.]|nr:sigma-70 family RNA polymerase sigma factor [Pedosphaera sp.]